MTPSHQKFSSMKTVAGNHLLGELLATNWEHPFHRAFLEEGVGIGTHPGFNRSRNEDRAAFASITARSGQRFFVAIVCDGVGSSEEGHLAATYAIAACFEELLRYETSIKLSTAVPALLREIDRFINEKLSGRGTTTASVFLATDDDQRVAVNIGDSRIFSWELRNRIRQISEDDTIENELRRLKIKDPSVIAAHGLKGSLSQALGENHRDKDGLQVVIIPQTELRSGILLASDGVWKSNSNGFDAVSNYAPSAFELVRRLLAVATWSGGHDNSTLIAIESIEKTISILFKKGGEITGCPKITAWFSDLKFQIFDSERINRPEKFSQVEIPALQSFDSSVDKNKSEENTSHDLKKDRSKNSKRERKGNQKKSEKEQIEIEISTEEDSSSSSTNS